MQPERISDQFTISQYKTARIAERYQSGKHCLYAITLKLFKLLFKIT